MIGKTAVDAAFRNSLFQITEEPILPHLVLIEVTVANTFIMAAVRPIRRATSDEDHSLGTVNKGNNFALASHREIVLRNERDSQRPVDKIDPFFVQIIGSKSSVQMAEFLVFRAAKSRL